MVYEKPEVAVAATSLKAIQSQGVKVSLAADNVSGDPDTTHIATPSAYEADE